MSKERFVITKISKRDAYYGNRDDLIGKIANDAEFHSSEAKKGYLRGFCDIDGESYSFAAIKVIKIKE